MVSFISLLTNVINPMFAVGRNKAFIRKIFHIFDERFAFFGILLDCDIHEHFAT